MWWWRTFCLLHAVLVVSSDDYTGDDDYVEEMNCLPQLADKCFSNVYADLECHFDPSASKTCKKNSVEILCRDIDDSLQCASDEIDSSCKDEDRFDFDAWLRGLDAIRRVLCSSNFKKLQVLVNSSRCWNGIKFLSCVESEAKIGHVVDLLHTKLTWDICSHFMLALATCNTRVTTPAWSCLVPQGIVTDAIHAFFTNTDCGQEVCKLSHDSQGHQITTSSVLSVILQFVLISLRQLY